MKSHEIIDEESPGIEVDGVAELEEFSNANPRVGVLLAGYRRHSLDPRAGALELNWRLHTTNAARHAFFVQRLESFGLRRVPAQYSVLRDIYFSESRCLAQNQIMRMTGVSSANVTRLIHGLERAGLVKREVNPEDKRSTVVTLTEAGMSFCESIVPAMGRDIRILADCFSDAELAILNELLARLHTHIEEMATEMAVETTLALANAEPSP
jgi:MarR family transcriptional regulator, transcriptional regulator for hemolysin